MCGLFSEEDRNRLFKQFWSFKTWDEKKGYVRGLVQAREIVRRRKLKKKKIPKKRRVKIFYYLWVQKKGKSADIFF